jgi:NAD-dependent deacetylase
MTLQSIIDNAKRIAFFGGAGVSTESNIPDFRSPDGLYNQKYDYMPAEILSHNFFIEKPSEFFRFYRDRMIYPDAKPNAAHRKLAELEQAGKLSAVITQNIDGLHTEAGSKNVIELHGSIRRNHCMCCGKEYGLDAIMTTDDIPRCACGGIIKPDVVLYEEPLDEKDTSAAIKAIYEADTLIVGGTSLNVSPARDLARMFVGTLVIINKSPTFLDGKADLVINANIGETLNAIKI